VSGVVVVDASKNFYDFTDNSIPANLNFTECLIDGETMTVIFQTGILTGKEFEVKYIHDGRRFEIVPQELDGRTMPDSIFVPAVGDTYAVFGMMMPNSYICDNDTKTGASWDMFREAAKYLYENEEQKFTFTGELDGIWAKKDWLNIVGKIKLGGYILFSDNQFQPDGVSIRIVGIKDSINNPHSPAIELSNEVVGSSIIADLRKIETNEVIVDDLHRDAIQFTKRRYRDSIETMNMLEAALLDNFTNSIQPVAVRTMALLVGDESLQFRFVNNTTAPVEVAHNVSYDNSTKILTSPAGILQHMTLGIDSVSSTHAVNEYKFWSLPAFNTPVLTDGKKKYYLYAKVSKSDTTGVFYLSETAIAMEDVTGYYHLLMGVLNSEYDGERSYASLYGFSEVLPGQLTTNKVISSDGKNFIDFLNNAARIGNSTTYLDFNTAGDGKLKLKGTFVQSQSGDEYPLGCFRGEYNNSYTYYKGDEVIYQGSTYLFISDTSASGKIPVTNPAFWKMVAARGTQYIDVYKLGATKPATPSGSVVPPSGWSATPLNPSATAYVWMSQTTVDAYGNIGTWSEPIRLNGADGTDMEYIYRRSTTETAPATPSTSQADDFVPTGWTDQPQGVNITNMYEWVSVRTKKQGVWSAFSTPVLWAKWGEKGMDGDGYEYIYRLTTTETAPATPSTTSQTDDFVPTGWTDDPTGTSLANRYEWVSERKKENGVWGAFSIPALWGKYGEDGAFFEYRYAKNGSTATAPALTATDVTPAGWSTTLPDVAALEYLWMTVAKKSTETAGLLQNWSTPVRTKGDKGDKGDPGDNGTNGSSPALVYRGVYNSATAYYGGSIRVDAVKYNDAFYVARTDPAGSGIFANIIPTNTDYWNSFGASFESVATNLLLANMANIGNWIIKDSKITSQQAWDGTLTDGTTKRPKAELDGAAGCISFYSTNDSSATAASTLDAQGIYFNTANKQTIPSTTGITVKAAIGATATGNVAASGDGANMLIGVHGDVSNTNSNPAPTYGGWFRNLKANGLYINTRNISSDTTLTENDVFISCYNTQEMALYLYRPQAPGKIHFVRKNNGGNINIAIPQSLQSNLQIMHPGGSLMNSIQATIRGELVILVWDGSYWLYCTTHN
jgi:hypothetical protein